LADAFRVPVAKPISHPAGLWRWEHWLPETEGGVKNLPDPNSIALQAATCNPGQQG